MLSSVTCSWYRTEVALQSRGTCGHQTPEPAKPRNKVKGVEASHAVAMPCGRHGCHALRSAVPGSGAACSGAALPSLQGERDPGALGRSGGAPRPAGGRAVRAAAPGARGALSSARLSAVRPGSARLRGRPGLGSGGRRDTGRPRRAQVPEAGPGGLRRETPGGRQPAVRSPSAFEQPAAAPSPQRRRRRQRRGSALLYSVEFYLGLAPAFRFAPGRPLRPPRPCPGGQPQVRRRRGRRAPHAGLALTPGPGGA